MVYIVSIENGQVVVTDETEKQIRIHNALDYKGFFLVQAGLHEQIDIYFSSTMDFPEDSTSDPATLALVREIRSISL